MLGYAYYLKTCAEYTFLQARKQAVTLEEDFNEEEGKTYNMEYFETKTKKHFEKSNEIFKNYPEAAKFLLQAFPDL